MENFAKVHKQVVQYNIILPLLVGSQKMLSTMHHVLNSLLVHCFGDNTIKMFETGYLSMREQCESQRSLFLKRVWILLHSFEKSEYY